MLDIIIGMMIGILFLGIILRVIEYRKVRKDKLRELKLEDLEYLDNLKYIYTRDLVGHYDNIDEDDILIFFVGEDTDNYDKYKEYKRNQFLHYCHNNMIKCRDYEEYKRNQFLHYYHNNMIKWGDYDETSRLINDILENKK